MRDEAYAPLFIGSENAYFSRLDARSLVYSGERSEDLELGFVVGPRLAPEAARMILALRQDRRAVILGEPLRTAVAEARMHPAGPGGRRRRAHRAVAGHARPFRVQGAKPQLGTYDPNIDWVPARGTPSQDMSRMGPSRSSSRAAQKGWAANHCSHLLLMPRYRHR